MIVPLKGQQQIYREIVTFIVFMGPKNIKIIFPHRLFKATVFLVRQSESSKHELMEMFCIKQKHGSDLSQTKTVCKNVKPNFDLIDNYIVKL